MRRENRSPQRCPLNNSVACPLEKGSNGPKSRAQPMRWAKEAPREGDDDIMSHPRDSEAWHALDRFDPILQMTLGVFVLGWRRTVSLLLVSVLLHTRVGPLRYVPHIFSFHEHMEFGLDGVSMAACVVPFV
ncbi:hypothetical protein U9M48_037905 [Paspalum notatum var. saurae]|uniref:Uncharacterized protein n=1 Tax=Paspalum notatum var. saurae TaxID=547442 RepID=A0AAQ3UM88_PASNO